LHRGVHLGLQQCDKRKGLRVVLVKQIKYIHD